MTDQQTLVRSDETPTTGQAPSTAVATARQPRRRRWAIVAATAILAVTAAILVSIVGSDTPEPGTVPSGTAEQAQLQAEKQQLVATSGGRQEPVDEPAQLQAEKEQVLQHRGGGAPRNERTQLQREKELLVGRG